MLLIVAGLPGLIIAYFICHFEVLNLCNTLSGYGLHQVLIWLILGSPLLLIGIHLWERHVNEPSSKYMFSSISPTRVFHNGFTSGVLDEFVAYNDIVSVYAYTQRKRYLLVLLDVVLMNGKVVTVEDKNDGWNELLTQLNKKLNLKEDIVASVRRLEKEHSYFGKTGKRVTVFKRPA